MKILHVLLTSLPIPPNDYGGTERVLWALYQGQTALGHQVRFFYSKPMPIMHLMCRFFDKSKPLHEQIDDWADMVHFHFPYEGELHKPFVCTEHSNSEVEKRVSNQHHLSVF